MPLRRLIRQIVKAIALQSDIKACVITIHKIRAGYYERVIHAVLDVFTYLVKQHVTIGIHMSIATPKSLKLSLIFSITTTRRQHMKLVGTGRFELPTSRLSVVRSNQLSYAPVYISEGIHGW